MSKNPILRHRSRYIDFVLIMTFACVDLLLGSTFTRSLHMFTHAKINNVKISILGHLAPPSIECPKQHPGTLNLDLSDHLIWDNKKIHSPRTLCNFSSQDTDTKFRPRFPFSLPYLHMHPMQIKLCYHKCTV
jgi:hypothetical protein